MVVNVLLGLALVVAVGGVAFAVGRGTAPATADLRTGFTGNGQGGPGGQFVGPDASGAPGRGQLGGPGGLGGAPSIQGTVVAMDATSITIKTDAGTIVTLALNGDTTYHTRASASPSSMTPGSTVIVQLDGRAFGNGQGRPTASDKPAASGAPSTRLGTAGSVTLVPAGS
jgi:hypothetical protein